MDKQEILKSVQWLARECQILFPQSTALSSRQVLELVNASDVNETNARQNIIKKTITEMKLDVSSWTQKMDETRLPAIAISPDERLMLITGISVSGQWQVIQSTDMVSLDGFSDGTIFAFISENVRETRATKAKDLFKLVLFRHKRFVFYAAIAAITGNVLALGGSLYSMQVYDRVFSTQNTSTLIILLIGAMLAAFTEFFIKLSRMVITESVAKTMDVTLSGRIFRQLLNIRMDQFPPSVGSLASQIRGFETVRVFMTTSVMYFLIDAPFALFFLIIIGLLAGPVVAMVPLLCMVLAIITGMYFKYRIKKHAQLGNDYSSQKHGFLVETIQNAELIKAFGVDNFQAARWHILEQISAENNMRLKRYNEHASYLSAFIQQASYIILVSVGAWISITDNTLTSGALIASSILSGRVLSPMASLPGIIMQWANAHSALDGLEKIFSLESDNHNIKTPLIPDSFSGEFVLTDVHFAWKDAPEILRLDKLHIRQGEKVAIIGGVGSGKSTLLKMLAGIFKPTSGTVLLDGMNIQQISRRYLCDKIGYCPQDVKLFAGTLRENLLAGLPAVNEQDLEKTLRQTGLDKVITAHPRGLGREIFEGGSGLSGGQKQLVTLSRLLLSRPDIWLLDEPTSAMDDMTENKCIQALQEAVNKAQTLVIVTHKPALLTLADRIIVVSPDGILLDGPKKDIIQRVAGSASRPETPQAAEPAISIHTVRTQNKGNMPNEQ